MSDTKDPRTLQALNGAHPTSLTAFMDKMNGDPATEMNQGDDSTEVSTEETVKEVIGEEKEDTTEDVSAIDTAEDDQEFEVKDKKVKLKDLVNSYETREEISRRFDDIGKREQRVTQERERIAKERKELDYINEKFEEMREMVLKGNPLGAMQIAMLMSSNGNEDAEQKATLKSLIEQAVTMADNYHAMSDEERAVFIEKEELAAEKKKIERSKQKTEFEEKAKKVEDHYNRILDTHNVTDDELSLAFDDVKNNERFKENLDKLDEIGKINYCTSWVLGKRLKATVIEGVKKVSPAHAEDQRFLLDVIKIVDANCTVDTVSKLVSDALAMANGKKDSAKVESAASTQSVSKKDTTSNRAPTEKPKAEEQNKPAVFTSFKDVIAKHS